MAVTLEDLSFEDRAEMRRHLLEAQSEMEDMISQLEDSLPVDDERLYSADEEVLKELLENAREVQMTVGILLNKIELSPAQIREHLVMQDETLPMIAAKEFGDASYWTKIAELNDFMDPMVLVAGQKVLLPTKEFEYEELVSE